MEYFDPAESDPTKIVNQLILGIIQSGANHLHIEPYEAGGRVRVRHHEALHAVGDLPLSVTSQVVRRFKEMSGLDLAECRVPQDGYLIINLMSDQEGGNKTSFHFLVRTIPVMEGEKVVVSRVSGKENEPTLDDILNDHQKSAYIQALSHEQGLILAAGPTGSGKAALLYHGMRMLPGLRGEDIPMATIEWAIRGKLQDATQIVVSSQHGITFDSAMKRLAEQGTKAILVGEIIDLATAEEAIRLTTQRRRLILSTVHTQDAPQALARLLTLGVPIEKISESVRLVFALRAIRKLCPACKKPLRLPRASLLAAGFAADEVSDSLTLWEPDRQGCEQCENGFRGRHYVCQMMPMTDGLRAVLSSEDYSIRALEKVAMQEGMRTLRQEFLDAAVAGHIRLGDADLVD